MSNEDQHQMLCGILTKLVPVLDCDELSLLAHSCGISISDFYGIQPDLLIEQYEFKEAA